MSASETTKQTAEQKAALYDFAIENNLINLTEAHKLLTIRHAELEERLNVLKRLQSDGFGMGIMARSLATVHQGRKGANRRKVDAAGKKPRKRIRAAKPAPTKTPAKKTARQTPQPATSNGLTEKQVESRKLQGRYISLLRRFADPTLKMAFQATAKQRGRKAAIKEMKAALRRRG